MQTTKSHPSPEEIEAILAKGKRGRLTLWLGGAVVIAVAAAALIWWQMPAEEEIHWVTGEIDRGDIVLSANATGTLQPRRTVTIGAEISGKIETVEVESNESVEVGQVLATFDTTVLEGSLALAMASLSSSQASVRRAEASLDEAESEEARTLTLVEREVAASSEAEAARTRTVRAVADLDQARAELDRATAQVADVQTELERAVIKSPVDGVILARTVEPGQTVASSLQAPELFLAAEDLSRMTLEVWVDEADVGLVEAGQSATFEVSAWPNEVFEATVETLDLQPTVTENVVTYIASLSVENPDHLLRPGMSAATTIITGEQNDVLRAPNAALRFQPPVLDEESDRGSALVPQMRFGRNRSGPTAEGIGTVHVLRNGEPTPIRVNTGRTDGRFTAIESDEIEEGDEIILRFEVGPPDEEPGERSGPPGGGDRPGGPS